jgi:hypothetical protein
MRILALDLSSHTGWARVYSTGKVTSGVLELALGETEHPGEFWKRVRRSFAVLAGGVEWIVWEKIITPASRKSSFSPGTLFVLEAQLVEVAFDLGVETKTLMPSTLKKHATGWGRSKKPAMLAAARAKWPKRTIATHDEADALWVLDWARKELAA